MKIAVINTGGTISCVGNPLAPMTSTEFKAACQIHLDPIIQQKFPGMVLDYVTDLAFPESASGMLDSTNLQPTDWCLIARSILEHYTDFDGWIVLHGTDTLDFSGTALSMLLARFDADGTVLAQLSKPVILTGSQVPLFHAPEPGKISGISFHTDAFENLCGAVAVARAAIPAVSVFFDNQLMRASRVVKANTSQFRAFASPNFPLLGQYGITLSIAPDYIPPSPVSETVSLDHPATRAATLAQLDAITAAINDRPVMQLNAVPAGYNPANGTAFLANIIHASMNQNIGGLVLESYGAGNFPSGNANHPEKGAIYQALDAANKAGVVIVDNTHVLQGAVNYNAYAAGAWLPAIGALNPADMTPTASLAKLTVLLAAQSHNGWSLEDVKCLMQTPLVGEMVDMARLDSRSNATLLPGQSLTTFNGSASLLNDPEHGPLLKNSTGETVWTMLDASTQNSLPARLRIIDNGNLVLYSRNNQTLWESGTSNGEGASSHLRLRQSADGKSVDLQIYDYAHQKMLWSRHITL
ncbi:L-asparaginase [Agrobacterium vitis]|nr:L-asparaginase [Agrobacterium vitis]MBE1437551.1 L-asparaginase [Agrobacterium vitis]